MTPPRMTPQDFLDWEKKARSIDYKPQYVDVAGSVPAAVLLSQILFWHMPSKTKGTRLTVQKFGRLWIAKTRADWQRETGLKSDALRTALTKLEKRGLVAVKVMRFHGNPTLHVSLDTEEFLQRLDRVLNPILPGMEEEALSAND